MAATLNLSSSKLPKIITEATKSLFQVFLSFKDNLVAFLLELERGGDLLVESPSQGSHHTSSQHSRGQAFAKTTHPSFPEI